jgi:acyl-CoA thioesterase FadM
LRARSLWRGSDAIQREATRCGRTKGRARLSHLGDAGGQQPQGRYFWRLDHVADGFGREDVGDPHAGGRVVTVAVSNITFLQPVHVGDTVCCYTDVKRVGRTSITLDVEVWVLRQGQGERVKVTDAEFTFVAVHEDGRPRELASSAAKKVASSARNSRRTTRQRESEAM